MGSQLWQLVTLKAQTGQLKGVSPNARIVLWAMAMSALDAAREDGPAACYFRGWEYLARVLGHDGLTPAGHKAVMRAIADLSQAGLIVRDYWPGIDLRKAVYRLELGPLVDNRNAHPVESVDSDPNPSVE